MFIPACEAQAEEILRAKSKNAGVDFARFERWFQSTVKVIAGGFWRKPQVNLEDPSQWQVVSELQPTPIRRTAVCLEGRKHVKSQL